MDGVHALRWKRSKQMGRTTRTAGGLLSVRPSLAAPAHALIFVHRLLSPFTPKKAKVQPGEITVEGVEKRLKELKRGERALLRPDSLLIERWDLAMMVALFFTASATPYEVALLPLTIGQDWLFWLNRLVDSMFLLDMVVQMVTMYYDAVGRLIKSRGRILSRYFETWFLIDFVTIIPWDFTEVFMPEPFHVIKGIRLLRLLKLFRLLRASRIFQRWQTKLGVQHSNRKLVKLVCMLFFFNHWFACTWLLVAGMKSDQAYTWMTAWIDNLHDASVECLSQSSRYANGAARVRLDGCVDKGAIYAAALHWAIMTITSIGYGDIVPTNTEEYAMCAGLMLSAGIAWAYIIGQICGIAAHGNPVTARFHESTDRMNVFMARQRLPAPFRARVRTHLLHSRDAMQERANMQSITQLCPSLAGEMVSMGHRWVREGMVPWARPGVASFKLLARLVEGMGGSTHPPRDVIPGHGRMLILRKGSCFTDTLVMVSSQCTAWNYDFFLSNALLRKNIPGRTVTYVQVDYLEREFFLKVLQEGWEEMPLLKSAFRRIALVRGLQFMQSHQMMLPLEWERHQAMERRLASHARMHKLEHQHQHQQLQQQNANTDTEGSIGLSAEAIAARGQGAAARACSMLPMLSMISADITDPRPSFMAGPPVTHSVPPVTTALAQTLVKLAEEHTATLKSIQLRMDSIESKIQLAK